MLYSKIQKNSEDRNKIKMPHLLEKNDAATPYCCLPLYSLPQHL